MADDALHADSVREMAIVRSLLDVGVMLYECGDRDQMLETILSQARAFAHAEAGTIYLVQGNRLRFVVVQNDKVGSSAIREHLLGEEMPISAESLAGYVALTGRVVNIPDSYSVSEGAAFRFNRSLDAKTGYRVESVLAIPLRCPHGLCVGVLQLFNRLSAGGDPAPFRNGVNEGIVSLASQAAMVLHSARLQDQLREAHLNTIFRLSAIAEYRDTDTGAHIYRVSRISELTARALGLEMGQVELIKYASPMHDVGKVAIPDAILLKPGHLTAEQREVMERHTVVGAEIFGEPEDEVLAWAQEVALRHHERWDGQGYPDGLAGESIPIASRIVGLADVFDAVVSKRCYKEACTLDVALDILNQDTGKHFDPRVVEAFLGILDEALESYPALQAA